MSKKSHDWKKIQWAGKIFQHLLFAGEPITNHFYKLWYTKVHFTMNVVWVYIIYPADIFHREQNYKKMIKRNEEKCKELD